MRAALLSWVVLVLFAAPAGAGESVAALERAALAHLDNEDRAPRREALKGLVARDGREAAEALLRVYEGARAKGQAHTRSDVAYFMKQLRSEEVAPVLRPLLASASSQLRAVATAVLAELGDEAAAPFFRRIAFSAEATAQERRAALEALGKTTRSPDDVRRFLALLQERGSARMAARALEGLTDPGLAPSLYPSLVDADLRPHQRASLCEVLGRLANPHAAVPLLDVVEREDDRRVADAAAAALFTTTEPEHLPRLEKLLRRPSGSTRSGRLLRAWVQADRRQGYAATRGFFTHDERLASRVVYEATRQAHPSDEVLAHLGLRAKEPTLQAAAAGLLGKLDSRSAEGALCEVLSDRSRPFQARAAAAASLGHFRTDASISCLIRTMPGEELKDDRSSTWTAITRSLERLTGEKLGDDFEAWRTWHEGGLRAGLEGLLRGLQHSEPAVRALAAERLRKHKHRKPEERASAAGALRVALEGERSGLAMAAMAEALGAMGDREATTVLAAALERAKDFRARVAIARSLDGLGDARGTLHFLDALRSERGAERAEAVRGLSSLTGEPPHHDVERWRRWWREYAERYRRE